MVSDSHISKCSVHANVIHPGLTYIFNFWHSGTLALSPERQSARMSEIKNVGYVWTAKCDQLTPLPFKGLKSQARVRYSLSFIQRVSTHTHKKYMQTDCHWRRIGVLLRLDKVYYVVNTAEFGMRHVYECLSEIAGTEAALSCPKYAKF